MVCPPEIGMSIHKDVHWQPVLRMFVNQTALSEGFVDNHSNIRCRDCVWAQRTAVQWEVSTTGAEAGPGSEITVTRLSSDGVTSADSVRSVNNGLYPPDGTSTGH